VLATSHVYLCFPQNIYLCKGHLWIIPREHIPSFSYAEENITEDLKEVMNKLCRAYEHRKKYLVFLESAYHFKTLPHTV
jgi:hypothetical protein